MLAQTAALILAQVQAVPFSSAMRSLADGSRLRWKTSTKVEPVHWFPAREAGIFLGFTWFPARDSGSFSGRGWGASQWARRFRELASNVRMNDSVFFQTEYE